MTASLGAVLHAFAGRQLSNQRDPTTRLPSSFPTPCTAPPAVVHTERPYKGVGLLPPGHCGRLPYPADSNRMDPSRQHDPKSNPPH